jgi:hypothetical protein
MTLNMMVQYSCGQDKYAFIAKLMQSRPVIEWSNPEHGAIRCLFDIYILYFLRNALKCSKNIPGVLLCKLKTWPVLGKDPDPDPEWHKK